MMFVSSAYVTKVAARRTVAARRGDQSGRLEAASIYYTEYAFPLWDVERHPWDAERHIAIEVTAIVACAAGDTRPTLVDVGVAALRCTIAECRSRFRHATGLMVAKWLPPVTRRAENSLLFVAKRLCFCKTDKNLTACLIIGFETAVP
jgi:hypothetical protein